MSGAMVAVAKRHAVEERLQDRVAFVVRDVREPGEERGFDAAAALFHVASYQTEDGDLGRMTRAARTALKPGGLYLFDYWYGPAVLAQKPDVRVRRAGDGERRVLRIAEPEHDTARSLVTVNYTLFCETRSTGAIHRVEEAHRVRYFTPEEIAPILVAEGFESLGHFAWMSSEAPGRDSWAAYVVARAV